MPRTRRYPLSEVFAAVSFILLLLLSFSQSAPSQDSGQKAWKVLQAGIQNNGADERAMAINALGLLTNDRRAIDSAERALADKEPTVRVAAMTALGQMGSKGSIPKMKETAKNDQECTVLLAGAHALLVLGDNSAYEVFYAILTGERKSGASLLANQAKMLKDPKKMAQFGFEAGIGFIPFASAGLGVIKAVGKDDMAPIRAAAVRRLATDPDPRSGKAIASAASDKSPVVRTAALNAIALRGDASLVSALEQSLSDSNASVRYTGAAALLRLTGKP